MERTAHFIHLPWTEFQVSRDQHALTFISAAVKGSTTTKGSEQGSIMRSHSRQTKALFLWLSNCSHHSGSSSTFNEMNAVVSLLHPHTINSEHLSHPICHSLFTAKEVSGLSMHTHPLLLAVTRKDPVMLFGTQAGQGVLGFPKCPRSVTGSGISPCPGERNSSFICLFHSITWMKSQGTSKLQGDNCLLIQP